MIIKPKIYSHFLKTNKLIHDIVHSTEIFYFLVVFGAFSRSWVGKFSIFNFSVAKATLQSQMSVRSSVRHKSKPLNSLKSSYCIIHPSSFIILHSSFITLHSSFITLHSSFLHFATFKLFSLFISFVIVNLRFRSTLDKIKMLQIISSITLIAKAIIHKHSNFLLKSP